LSANLHGATLTHINLNCNNHSLSGVPVDLNGTLLDDFSRCISIANANNVRVTRSIIHEAPICVTIGPNVARVTIDRCELAQWTWRCINLSMDSVSEVPRDILYLMRWTHPFLHRPGPDVLALVAASNLEDGSCGSPCWVSI
jgi:hypothetical protein